MHAIKDGADGFRDGTKLAETFKTKGGKMFKIRIPVEVEGKPQVYKMEDQYTGKCAHVYQCCFPTNYIPKC